MKQLKKKWKIHIIQHSHTDIGYTERQEKIEAYHVDFIRQAVDILDKANSTDKEDWKGFKWVCEGFWGVEKFLEQADNNYIEAFENYVKNGQIGLSGNYLNLTELIKPEVLSSMLNRAKVYGDRLGVKIDCGMTADINGYSWGYADCLYENGIENLISFVHTHHGMFPMWRRQTPFWWEGPKGNKVFVWNADHYHLGNELGFVRGHEITYMFKDEFSGTTKTEEESFQRAEKRIFNYIEQLEREDYPYNFIPAAVSGIISDNAPPNGRIMDFINKWNSSFGDQIELEMSNLNDFFKIAHDNCVNIPTYKGDWTDWWADGVGSTPAVVRHFRDAQRKYMLCKQLDKDNALGDIELMKSAEYDLALYAEHTWGYSASVSEPWSGMVNDLDLRKSGFAINANQSVSRNLDKILVAKGECQLRAEAISTFKVINPHDFEIKDIAKIYLGYWERAEEFEILEEATGTVLSYQIDNVARGFEVNVPVQLLPKEEKIIVLKIKGAADAISKDIVDNFPEMGSDGIRDLKCSSTGKGLKTTPFCMETPYFKILFKEKEGITSIIDKTTGKDLINTNKKYNAFTPIYEVTPVSADMCTERRIMGRNRKSVSTDRYTGILKDVKVLCSGDLFSKVELKYEVKGTSYFSIVITAYRDTSKIDVAIRLNKDNTWEPENLYIALPFTTGKAKEELWIEKSGCTMRPGIDQLYGSGMDFYSIQEGLAYISGTRAVIIAVQDAPLIHMGTLEAHEIELYDGSNLDRNKEEVFSWVMNNFWETNFKASLGGFYEFNYHIYSSEDITKPEKAMDMCYILNQGITTIRVK